MRIKDIPVMDRPREKLIKYGPQKLKDEELLALIIGSGRKGESAIEISKKIFRKVGTDNFFDLNLNSISNFSGLGKAKSASLIAALELGKRIYLKKQTSLIFSPKDVWEKMSDLRNSKKEHFVVFYLDVRNQVIKREIISIGTLNTSLVHPREVFEPAVRNNAAQILISHNHPSGDSSASTEDIVITKRLYQAGELMGIELVDHVIVSEKDFYSMKERGQM